MRKFVVIVVLLVVGIKYGMAYLFSDKFQEYADRTKAPWTCHLENFMGEMCMIASRYNDAEVYFTHTVKRCGKMPMVEHAEFGIAQAWEKQGQFHRAARAYEDFAEKYKGSQRARTAARAAQVMSAS